MNTCIHHFANHFYKIKIKIHRVVIRRAVRLNTRNYVSTWKNEGNATVIRKIDVSSSTEKMHTTVQGGWSKEMGEPNGKIKWEILTQEQGQKRTTSINTPILTQVGKPQSDRTDRRVERKRKTSHKVHGWHQKDDSGRTQHRGNTSDDQRPKRVEVHDRLRLQ